MNRAIKTTFFNSNTDFLLPFRATCSLFHSTPILERQRRNFWDSRCNHYSRRFRRMHAKQTLLCDVNAYAEFLFLSWKDDIDNDDPSSSQGTWFRKQYSPKGSERYRNGNDGSRTCFRNERNSQWRNSEGFSNHGKSFNQRYWSENAYDPSTESESDCSYSDRLALGLNASGPLKFEDVKNAYRACALKWHPDRHQGSSKVMAEGKFKHCSAAYQSLCDKLSLEIKDS